MEKQQAVQKNDSINKISKYQKDQQPEWTEVTHFDCFSYSVEEHRFQRPTMNNRYTNRSKLQITPVIKIYRQ